MAGAFISANFLFGPSSFVREVPYDPNLYFFGEEISLAVRLWTHGYNIYHPNRAILYCDWDRSKRSTHFDDHHDWSALAALAHARVRSLLGVSGREGDPAWPEDDLYGLGKFRSIMDYQDWSGIDFSAQTVSASALKGRFPASLMRTYSASARVLIEDDELIVVDDFLPDEDYKVLRDFLICEDYKHINSSGVIERAWHLQDRFPLRSETSWILSARESDGDKPDWMIPTGRPIDHFMQAVKDFQSDRVQRIGVCGVDWDQFSATGWIYPPGTGLAMHTDGANVYRGAYVYFMNDSWRSHWGGLLVVMDSTVNQYVEERQKLQDGMLWYRRRWLHENELESLMLDGGGMGRVVFPKANRIAFLGNKAYHMVTRINEESGDVLRLSLAGFFFVPKA
jgi:Rps23 Pro-64 3,4-dihydroxylase Tpa1-like proline 4-hydroxylase